MHFARRLLAQRRLAMLVCVATLLLRVIVPAGYMIANDHGQVAITVCPGVAPQAVAAGMSAMHAGMAGHDKAKGHGQSETPCAFAGLSAAAIGAIDPILLLAAIAFVMAVGLYPVRLPVSFAPAHLRPPLRGPPAHL